MSKNIDVPASVAFRILYVVPAITGLMSLFTSIKVKTCHLTYWLHIIHTALQMKIVVLVADIKSDINPGIMIKTKLRWCLSNLFYFNNKLRFPMIIVFLPKFKVKEYLGNYRSVWMRYVYSWPVVVNMVGGGNSLIKVWLLLCDASGKVSCVSVL